MTTPRMVRDDETVLKNIPKGRRYQGKGKPNTILPINFELYEDEIGKSVWQNSIVWPEKVLDMTPSPMRGNVASAVVGKLHSKDFQVMDVPDEINCIPGHAEVRGSATRDLKDLGDRQLLCELFSWHQF